MERMISRSTMIVGLGLLAALALQPVSGENEAPRLKKPKAFPAVTGAPKDPAFATVALDTWTGQVAYLMVEGSSSNGFTRVFAWIPGDSRLGRPVEWKPKTMEANPNGWNFGDLENKASEGEEKVRIIYHFYTVKEARGAGSDSSFDYVTGKTVTRSWGAATWHRMRYTFTLGYAYGNAPAASMDGGYPLEVGNGDDLRLYSTWEQVPEPGHGGFSANIRAKHEVQESRDPKNARLLCTFDGFEGAAIKKSPPDLNVGLTITPYMGEAIYSNTLTMAEFMKTGFDTDVPYGWYTFRLRGFRYGRFVFAGYFQRIGIDPVPVMRPSAGDK